MSWSGGDWICSACQHQNFRKREACQRCGYPKFHGPDPAGWTRVLPGDWYCTAMNCGAHNYASRPSCYRCGTSRNEYGSSCGSESTFPPGWKSEWDVENIIMLAGMSVSDAKHEGILVMQFSDIDNAAMLI
ncbi:conserved hypothetical protein [Ricinus communis]|uniref:RanBP2-type domain-containing protein n=1 Tax=Ricinus communis TaxID=3988 RepID=B9SEN7_RICCO|nr:conserved hypothetical protein [Ricinus communis]